jgi:hypothetical protein
MTRTEELKARRPSREPHAPDSAREMLAIHIGHDPYDLVERLDTAGNVRAGALAVAYQLENETKSLLARLASEYAVTHAKEGLSEAKLERLARADQRFSDHIKGTAVAIENREKANNEYWRIRTLIELDRSAIAHQNALTRMDG